MKKFNFRLHKVEETYRIREQVSQRKLAEASRSRDVEVKKLIKVLSEYNNENDIQKARIEKGFQAGDAVLQHRYGEKLKRKSIDLDMEVEQKNKIVAKLRQELTEAMQRRKVLESLHEKKLSQHTLNEQREEQFELDDQAARQYDSLKKIRAVTNAG